MGPDVIRAEQWDQIGRVMVLLYLFVGLALNGALALLLGHAIIPSLVATADAPDAVQVFRRVLYPVSAVSLVLTVFTLGWALYLAVDVLRQIYPRFWM
jgi:hypothetical protein